MKDRELIKKLQEEIRELKKQLPLKTYVVKLQNEDEIEIQAHGFNWADHKVTFWVHPFEEIAFFNNPVFVK